MSALGAPLILVGLPGAGKSTVGAAVAERLGVPFHDFDVALARSSGLSVPQLFAEQGESAFRNMETELTRTLLAAPPGVWAPGGGWVTAPGVLALVAGVSCMIHLQVSVAGALARLRSDASIRPLLAVPAPSATLDRLWQERARLYATAAFQVDTENAAFEQVVDRVCEIARTAHRPLEEKG
jgi:shikimate kinase